VAVPADEDGDEARSAAAAAEDAAECDGVKDVTVRA